MSYGADQCSKPIGEECDKHPIACEICAAEDGCQYKADFNAHPTIFKRCRFFRPLKE